ncbi:4'-phosphopantetheinyl transferase family protein [Maribacter forsetii]|uniref:4'-phosphopantetheinyl transferase family protein n=1 Tax=Maribacter forsetii TaxID=444515 RepID=UPI00069258F1|nr:4'-phosphopantetheinyl transferase superfamily protein [Maribacter forsetii]
MTHVLYTYLTDDDNDSFFVNAEHRFSADFVSKYSKYKRWQDAKSTVLGRLLLAYGLKNLYQVDVDDLKISFSKDKKPFLENSSIQFNISHSKDVIVCAITSVGEIGVDVEKINDINIQDFKDQFSQTEYESINASANALEQFFTFWTQKEAVVKSNGAGLHIPLNSFDIANNFTLIGNTPYHLKEIVLDPEYKCHMATEQLIFNDNMTVTKISSTILSDFMSVNSFKLFL